MFKSYLLFIYLCFLSVSSAQHQVTGYVYSQENNIKSPLIGANVYWEGSNSGTITIKDGYFSLAHKTENKVLVVSYFGYKSVKLSNGFDNPVVVLLIPGDDNILNEVIVSKERKALQRAVFTPQNLSTIGSAELLKAACCNLSESFETNPSIDVNYADALTGGKQIQMLGLTSPYILFTQENIPNLRGSNQTFGLSFTPGTWVESIQITKGMGTVSSGYESISGQINAELIKPLSASPFFVNGYRSANGNTELNVQAKYDLNSKWATALFVHANKRSQPTDNNNDGFMDLPISKQLNIINRWQYIDAEKGWVGFASFKALVDEKQVGQMSYMPALHKFGNQYWGGELDTNKWEFSLKTGYVDPEVPYRSFGFQSAISRHKQSSYFGNKIYNVNYSSFFHHLVYQSILGNTLHKFKAGLQYMADVYDETILTTSINRIETNLGAFFEYNYDGIEGFNAIIGARVDYHNIMGTFVTPRVHLRHAFFDNKSILRVSAGEGRRISSIFAENQKFFGSQRKLFLAQPTEPIYGLLPERAWNYGFSWIQKVRLMDRLYDFIFDFYRTQFTNRVVVDWETPGAISFYNLEGKSHAQSMQFTVNTSLTERIDLRFAYKKYLIKTTYRSGFKQFPLQAENRWFAFLGYTSVLNNGKQWRADATLHRVGRQRRVASFTRPSDFVAGFSLVNMQLTRQFSKKFSFYTGAENLLDIKQSDAVLSFDNPFSVTFDTSQLYAPVFGRMFYAGFRLNF